MQSARTLFLVQFAFAFHTLNYTVLRELPPLLKLAGPVILAEIGWMVMGIVDTMMVGPLGPAAIGAAGLGSGVFTAIAIFGMGLMLGLDAYVSQTHGAGDEAECRRWLHSGVWLAAIVGPPIVALTWLPICLARSVGTASRDSCARRAVSARSLVGRDPAALLRRVPPLLAGHASGPAGHVGPGERQPDQRAGQLDPDLRTPRRTRHLASKAPRGRRRWRGRGWQDSSWWRLRSSTGSRLRSATAR